MPLEKADQEHLQAASGYIQLGLLEEANAELENIEPSCRQVSDVLLARLPIYRGLEKWELMEVVARKLVEWNPREQVFWIDLAYATRRTDSLLAAAAVLTEAQAYIRVMAQFNSILPVMKRNWGIGIARKRI